MIRRWSLVVALSVLFADRAPAPIEEDTPSPSPTPAASAAPSSQEAARFAGTWTGKIAMENGGAMDFTLVVNPQANALIQKSKLVESVHVTTRTDSTLSWQTGRKNEISWTLTPAPNGQTALATRRIGGATVTGTFRRVVQNQGTLTSPTPRRPHRRQGSNQ